MDTTNGGPQSRIEDALHLLDTIGFPSTHPVMIGLEEARDWAEEVCVHCGPLFCDEANHKATR